MNQAAQSTTSPTMPGLKMIERLAVPHRGSAWQMHTDIGSIKEQQPVITERVKNLELRRQDGAARRLRQKRAHRPVPITIVNSPPSRARCRASTRLSPEQKSLLRDINQKLSASPGGRAK